MSKSTNGQDDPLAYIDELRSTGVTSITVSVIPSEGEPIFAAFVRETYNEALKEHGASIDEFQCIFVTFDWSDLENPGFGLTGIYKSTSDSLPDEVIRIVIDLIETGQAYLAFSPIAPPEPEPEHIVVLRQHATQILIRSGILPWEHNRIVVSLTHNAYATKIEFSVDDGSDLLNKWEEYLQ